MAISQISPLDWKSEYDPNVKYNVQDVIIGGKAVSLSVTASEFIPKSEIKNSLAYKLAQFIIDNNLAEFTFLPNHMTGENNYKIRCYLAPSADVKILRIHGNIS